MRFNLEGLLLTLSFGKNIFLSLLEQNFENEVNEGMEINTYIFPETVGVLLAGD
jgi:hypothetical protein